MATEKTPLKIYRGVNGTNTSSGSVPALQAGTLIFNEGLGFFTLDVNTSKATVSDAAKALLIDTVDFMSENLSSTDSFKILNSDDNNNIMRLPLLASGAFYATYANRASQADIALYTQLDNDAEKNWKHSISDSFLHTNNEYIILGEQIKRQITKIDNSTETEVVTSADAIFQEVVQRVQSVLQPVTFQNAITISPEYSRMTDPKTGNTYLNIDFFNPSLYLEQYAILQTEDNIVLSPKKGNDIRYQQGIFLDRYNLSSDSITNTVAIYNNEISNFDLGITTSSSYTPTNDYDLVTVAYMRDNAGGKAIFRRWS